MDITGKITAALDLRKGVSQRTGNEWARQDFVIEWFENQYPRHCVFTVFGKERLAQMNLQVGQEYTISFDIDAHEFNGRWYNDLRAWRATAPVGAAGPAPATAPVGAAPAAAPAGPAPAAPQAQDVPSPQAGGASDTVDDLPF